MPRRAWLPLVVSLWLAGCASEVPSVPSQAELDRLRALPYAGSSAVGDEGSGVTLLDRDRMQPGLTLYTVQELSRAELVDETGEVLRSWSHAPSARWERSELLSSGHLLVIGADPAPPGVEGIPDDTRYMLRLDATGRLVWKRYLRAHHDVEELPDGRLLALTFERRRVAGVHRELETRDDLLTLLDAEGQELERLSLLAAFSRRPDVLELEPVRPDARGVVPWVDLLHANSVESIRRPDLAGRHPIFEPGNVLLALRHQDCIAVVSRERGELVWAWGRGELLGPHDARLLPSGNILVFDNGVGRQWSRVVEVDPTSGAIVWEYRADPPGDFYTISKGSSQRLANGNTLIAESDRGTAFEVTPAGETVWRFHCPHEVDPGRRAAIVRAIRYPRERLHAAVGALLVR